MSLAIEGGAPVRTEPMPKRRAMGEAETLALWSCLGDYDKSGEDPGYRGVYHKAYCEEFAAYQGGGFADAVATGTAALYVALCALELAPKSIVLCSPITDPGTLSAIILAGHVPALCDTAPQSYGIGPAEVTARLGAFPQAAALMAVHPLGCALPIGDIIDSLYLNATWSGIVIEDCSQAHGAKVEGRPVGTLGAVAAFSTMYRKAHIMGGSGGVVFTRIASLHRAALAYADRGKPRWQADFDDRDPRQYLHPALNLNSTELACAIGRASLARLDDTRAKRLAVCRELGVALAAISKACHIAPPTADDSPFALPVWLDASIPDPEGFAKALLAEGIPLNPRYRYLASEWPWLTQHLADSFVPANALAARDSSFILYLNEHYGALEIADIAEAIAKVEAHYRR